MGSFGADVALGLVYIALRGETEMLKIYAIAFTSELCNHLLVTIITLKENMYKLGLGDMGKNLYLVFFGRFAIYGIYLGIFVFVSGL